MVPLHPSNDPVAGNNTQNLSTFTSPEAYPGRSASLLHQLLKRLPDDLKPKLLSFRQVRHRCEVIQLTNDLSGSRDHVLSIARKQV
jgi:hypothetical protein